LLAVHPDIQEILIPEDVIGRRVSELGEQITRDYAGCSVLVIGILKGAAVFLADLIRSIDLPTEYDFVSISSYRDGTKSSGDVKVVSGIRANVEGRHVLIVEDIVDTGWTLRMSSLIEDLLEQGAASVKVCALLDKPSRREVDVPIDYRGFVIEDQFVVGYGLDWAGRYRNLRYVGVLKQEIHG
jgi:hypoxanthine phosphoribosyltransferase